MPDVKPCAKADFGHPHPRHNWEEQSSGPFGHRQYHMCWGVPEKAELPEAMKKDIADFIAAYAQAQEEIGKTLGAAIEQFASTITLRNGSAEAKLAEVRKQLTGIMTGSTTYDAASDILGRVFEVVEFIDKGKV